jgi:hypothetical protein
VTIAVKDQAGVETPKRKREEDELSTPHTKVEWLLRNVSVPTTQTSGEDVSEETHLSVEPKSA